MVREDSLRADSRWPKADNRRSTVASRVSGAYTADHTGRLRRNHTMQSWASKGRDYSMRRSVVAAVVFVLACQVAVAAPPKKLFDTTLEDVQGGGRVLNIGFYGKLPPPSVVDKILR